tara:strand:- start:191 stop:778 length:588 start_codon:yes stop_codon:yes gene_type:complete
MSTLKTGALRGTSGSADSIQLHASNQSVTFPGDVNFTTGKTVTIPSGATITNSGTATGFGGGKVLQVFTVISNTNVANPGSFTTAFSQAITPQSSSSKIVVFCSAHMSVGATSELQVALYDGTIRKGYREHRNYSSDAERTPFSALWVAEGSYTAGTAYTFEIQAVRSGGSNTCEIGNASGDWYSYCIFAEIDAS